LQKVKKEQQNFASRPKPTENKNSSGDEIYERELLCDDNMLHVEASAYAH